MPNSTRRSFLKTATAATLAGTLLQTTARAAGGKRRKFTMDLRCGSIGVIDLKTFLSALIKIGYDGPVRAEPFKKELRSLSAEEAVGQTAAAMKKAFALVE